MTKVLLLKTLRDFTKEVTKDMLFPVERQERDETDPSPRSPFVFIAGMPEFAAYTSKAPYVLHQIVTGVDAQPQGTEPPLATAAVRTIFCVYHKSEEEGGLLLLELMERLRIAFLKQVVLADQFELITEEGLETLVYPRDPDHPTRPYYFGEMASVWWLPGIEREGTKPWLSESKIPWTK